MKTFLGFHQSGSGSFKVNPMKIVYNYGKTGIYFVIHHLILFQRVFFNKYVNRIYGLCQGFQTQIDWRATL